MALKKLKVKMASAPATKPGEAPVIIIEGDLVEQYNKADAQEKAAKAVKEDLRPEILEIGCTEVYRRCIATPADPACTVKLQDERGEVLRVQFTSKYGVVPDVDVADALFEELSDAEGNPVDINDFLEERVAATFNCDVFNGTDGKFSKAIYDKFRLAIERVAASLEVACPLETVKVVKPLPVLHEKRWTVFPDVEAQQKLTLACPNTTQIVPVTRKA